jgi:acetyl esterase/lipase
MNKKLLIPLASALVLSAAFSTCLAQAPAGLRVERDVAYADASPLQKLDIYAPAAAKGLPVMVCIHGGGWQGGDKTNMDNKLPAFTDKGFVVASVNYRLLPAVPMIDIFRDVAKSIGWVHKNIASRGGDPKRLIIIGHSAGAQLAALMCIDDRYLRAEGVPFTDIKGSVPVDGDTYDLPAIIDTAETRLRVHGMPMPKYGHRLKFGNDPALHRDYSAVTHAAAGKNIPPFLIFHVAEHPDNSAQAQRLGAALKAANVPVKIFAAKDTGHSRININLGIADDPPTVALWEFLGGVLK